MRRVDDHRCNEGPAMKNVFAIALPTFLWPPVQSGPTTARRRLPRRSCKMPSRAASSRNPRGALVAGVWGCRTRQPRAACACRQFGSALRVRSSPAARAVFVERKLDYAPHVQLEGTYSHFDEQQPGFGLSRINAQSDSLGFDAAWEIDLFGHVRRSVEAARADLGAERANYQDAQVTVAAEVARNYFELRGAQAACGCAREPRHRTSNAQAHATAG